MNNYPKCKAYGLKVTRLPHCPVVTDEEINAVFPPGGNSRKWFNHCFGCQTRVEEGLYAWDVEAVLERMDSGKLTGTQLYWD